MTQKQPEATATPAGGWQRLANLATIFQFQAEEVRRIETSLAEAKTAFLRTQREDLPMMMEELGVQEVRLSDGRQITVSEDVEASISEARRSEAHAWLIARGFGGLVKTNVVAEFPPGAVEEARKLAKQLQRDEPRAESVVCVERVHPQTLRAWVREQLAAAQDVPLDLFGVRPYDVAKVK